MTTIHERAMQRLQARDTTPQSRDLAPAPQGFTGRKAVEAAAMRLAKRYGEVLKKHEPRNSK